MATEQLIHDRGRGPEIVGTRITVYDVLDYHTYGDHHTLIAASLGLSSVQVLAALKYIEEHRVSVMNEYERMNACEPRENPPEVRAKLRESHKHLLARQQELRRKEERKGGNARLAG